MINKMEYFYSEDRKKLLSPAGHDGVREGRSWRFVLGCYTHTAPDTTALAATKQTSEVSSQWWAV